MTFDSWRRKRCVPILGQVIETYYHYTKDLCLRNDLSGRVDGVGLPGLNPGLGSVAPSGQGSEP